MTRKSWIFGFAAVVVCGFGAPASAEPGTNVSSARITSLGCHTAGDAICWINVDKDFLALTPVGCRASELRFDASSATGKNAFSLIEAAFLSGKKFSFQVHSACFSLQPWYPTFAYFTIS